MFKDLRGVLDNFEANGRLLRIKSQVAVDDHRIAAAMRNVSDTDGPALLFENIKGFPGWRVAAGLIANPELTALGLRVPRDKLFQFFIDLWEKKPMLEPVIVPTGPVKEVIRVGDEVNLLELPIPVHGAEDRGHLINGYIGAGVQIAKVPGTNRHETAMCRMTPVTRNTITLFRGAGSMREMIEDADKTGRGLEIAVAIGVEPAIAHSSQFSFMKGEVDELAFAGGMSGAPLELVKCETIDVEVPANAEIVLETVAIPGERKPDGPYGDVAGFYTGSPNVPVVKVTAITMRKDPIYHDLLTGVPSTDNHWLKAYALAAMDYWRLKQVGVDVADVVRPPAGSHTYQTIVSIHKRKEEDARQVILTLLGTAKGGSGISNVIVVDDDINIHDRSTVEWAIINRVCEPERFFFVPTAASSREEMRGHAEKRLRWGLDATMPVDNRFRFNKIFIPGQDKVDWRKGEEMFENLS